MKVTNSYTLSRRRFAGLFGAAVVGNSFGSRRLVCANWTAHVDSTRVISHALDAYSGWPTLTRLQNGQLILVCSGGREKHVCPFGRVEMMRSDDDGEHWTWPRTLLDSPIDDRDAGIVETSSGALLVTTFTSLAYQGELDKQIALNQRNREQDSAGTDLAVEPKAGSSWSQAKLKRWQAAHDRLPAAARKKELGQWMIRSTDGGVTWSERYDCIVNSPHGPIQMSDGRLLYAGKKLWTGGDVGLCESRDDGVTWQWVSAIPTRPGDDPANYHELHAVEADDGRLIVHVRNHNTNHNREILQCESADGGKTWSTLHPIGVWGLPSHLLKLRSGRLLMTYGYRRPPFGNQARVSDDHGQTWSDPMTISSDGFSHDLGYPSTVELDQGQLLTVWYERLEDSPHAVLRQVTWRIHNEESS